MKELYSDRSWLSSKVDTVEDTVESAEKGTKKACEKLAVNVMEMAIEGHHLFTVCDNSISAQSYASPYVTQSPSYASPYAT